MNSNLLLKTEIIFQEAALRQHKVLLWILTENVPDISWFSELDEEQIHRESSGDDAHTNT